MFVANANNSYSEEKDEGWEFVKGKEKEVGEVVVFQLEIPMRVVSKRKPGPIPMHFTQQRHLPNVLVMVPTNASL